MYCRLDEAAQRAAATATSLARLPLFNTDEADIPRA